MEIQLLLAAFIISFGIISAQPDSQMDSTKALTGEMNHENKLQKNLRNLFDSITKNDMRKTDTYRGILEQERIREQQVFDTMKEELWSVRQRNAYQHYKNSDIGEKTAASKRETSTSDDDDEPKMMDLFNAAERNDLEKVKSLVETVKNVSITANNGRGDTLGHIAARNNNVNLLRFVLDKFGDQADELYLHIIFQLAVEKNSVDVVKYFVEERNTNIQKGTTSELRTTVMHTAIQYGHLNLLKYFIEERNADVNSVDWCDVPLVFYSVEYGHEDIMKYLIEEKQADLTKVDHYQDCILYGPVKRGDIAMLKYLLEERQAKIDINWRNRNGETLVNKAVFWDQFEVLKYLVEEKHADVNVPDKWLSMTPLHFTVSLNRFEMFKYLIEHGADTQVQDEKWRTAIELTTDERFLTYLNSAKKAPRRRRDALQRC